VHGETAVVIKNGIIHHLHGHYTLEHLQATSVTIEDWIGPLMMAAVYCPKHTIKAEQFQSFYATLGHRFLTGGVYNTKHSIWGCRLTTPRGRVLFQDMQVDNLTYVSTGETTYCERNTCIQHTCCVRFWPILRSLPSYKRSFENHSATQFTNPQHKNNEMVDILSPH
jgi:hypothetical protein